MAERRTARITLTIARTVEPKAIIWDDQVKGFGISGNANGTASFFLKTRVQGRQRWLTIGKLGSPWTPETARKEAKRLLAEIAGGNDPAQQRGGHRPAEVPFADTAKRFLEIHGPKLKPSTRATYQSLIGRQLVPAFKAKTIESISAGDIAKFHAKWAHKPRTANHAVAVLSKIMSWAEVQGCRPEGTNPCPRIQRYKENHHDRFLQPEELARLGAAIEEAESTKLIGPYALAAIRLLIFTGARLSEILTLKWSYIDLDRRMIFLPDSKTGKKPLSLNDPAIEVLTALPRFANNPYVIVGNRHGSHLVNLQKPWRAIRAIAGLDDVRIHDLRHTFASVAVASGGSLPVIGRQLGHSQPQTTQRYAHLADDPVRQLSQSTGEALARSLHPAKKI